MEHIGPHAIMFLQCFTIISDPYSSMAFYLIVLSRANSIQYVATLYRIQAAVPESYQ